MRGWTLWAWAPLWLGLPGSAVAAPGYVAPFAPGEPIYAFDVRYRAVDRTLAATAKIVGPTPAAFARNYHAFINGVNATPSPAVGGTLLLADVPIGPDFPTGGPWPAEAPFAAQMSAEAYVPKPIVVEIVRNTTDEVVLRQRGTIYDLRKDGLTSPAYGVVVVDDGVLAQLTPRGLDALEGVHQDDLPYPSDAVFDAELDARAMAVPRRYYTLQDQCRPLNELYAENPDWLDVPAVSDLATRAWVSFGVHVGLSSSPDPGSQAVAALMCVQSRPQPNDFEVCVGRIAYDLESVDVADVTNVDLSFDPTLPRTINTDLQLADPYADYTATLQSLSVRYTGGGPACAPTLDLVGVDNDLTITNQMVTSEPWLAEWATCEHLSLDADFAIPVVPLKHRDTVDVGSQTTTAETAADAVFDIPLPRSDAALGTCAGSWILGAVDTGLRLRVPDVEEVLSDTWNDGAPFTQSAEALDVLLATFELGTCDVTASDFEADVVRWTMNDSEGLVARWDTRLEALDPLDQAAAPAPWLYRAPTIAGWMDGTTDRNPFGANYDLGVAVTTTHLNQHLRVRAGTHGPQGFLAPTYNELGATPPPGSSGSDVAILDGASLGAWFPSFASLGASTATIEVIQRLPPMVWMEPDPLQTPFGETKVGFWYPDLIVRIKTTGRTPVVLAEVHVDLWDDDVILVLPQVWSQKDLFWALSAPVWLTMATRTPAGCTMLPIREEPAFQGACDDLLADKVLDLVRPRILAAFAELTQGVVVPTHFDTDGMGVRAKLETLSRVSDSATIGWFGPLR